MSEDLVLLAKDGPVVTLTLNRPEKLNALNRALITRLGELVNSLDNTTRVMVLTGSGPKAFAAGADIAAMQELNTVQAKSLADLGHHVGHLLEHAPFVTIAAVNGFALGGGCEIAMACDLIYAADHAKFGQPEVNLGVIPGFGGTQRLIRRVGVGKARELIFTGDIIGAEEAHRIGLCEQVFARADLMEKVAEVARKIASKGPLAIAQAKTVMRHGDPLQASANELEAQAFSMLFGSHDQREGMSAFVEKRVAMFEGR